MARNEHDGRSLEERLASLDAMSGETPGHPPATSPAEGEQAGQTGQGGQAGQQAPAENAPPDEVTLAGSGPPDPNTNPWLTAPPSFQQSPETGYPPENFGPPQPPPYEGGPMPQPFDGGMLPPPPYAGGTDPSQAAPPQPPAPPQQPPPQQSPYDTGDAAPPLDRLPPYPPGQFAPQDPNTGTQAYQPIDPATGQPFPQDTDASGRPYVPLDPATGRPLPPADPNAGPPHQPTDATMLQPPPPPAPPAGQYPPDPSSAGRPFPQDAGMGGAPYPPADPATGQPYAHDPGAPGLAPDIDPVTGQPFGQDAGAGSAPYQPATGQPYAQESGAPGLAPDIDPVTGRPFGQDAGAGSASYQPAPPATGQPYAHDPGAPGQAPDIDPVTGRPFGQEMGTGGSVWQSVDPATGQPYAHDPGAPFQGPEIDPVTRRPFGEDAGMGGAPYQPVDPATGQPYGQGPAAGGQYPPADPSTGQPYGWGPGAPGHYPPADPNTGRPMTGQPYGQDPNTGGRQYPPVDPATGQPVQGYGGYPAPPEDPSGYPDGLGRPMQPPPGHQQQGQEPQTADSLSSENLLGERRIAPSSGWRRAVYKASAGNIHPGESQHELRRKDLIARARTMVSGGHHRVAVMSLKGGVGKTTTTTGLGSMLGSLRGDRVIAVDANPDRGTLSDKVTLETAATVRDLLNNRDQIARYADVRAFTSQNEARLEFLASDRDPAVSEAFSADDYAAVAVVLEQYYSVCITDCGTGLLHSAMAGVLSLADQLVLVSSPSVDGARSASATLDWLEAHDHGHLVRNGVVVLSMVRNRTRSQVDLDKLQAHFESRCRAVVRIPYDDHLEEGAEIALEQLAPATREAYLNLAAAVGDGFAYQRPPDV